MKKRKGILEYLIIVLLVVCSLFLNINSVFATTNGDEPEGELGYEIIYEIEQKSEEELIEEMKHQLMVELGLDSTDNINIYTSENIYEAMYPPMGRSTTLIATKYFTKQAIGWAGNQLSGGVVFNTGGYIYWADNGGYTTTVSLSLSRGFVSLGISQGYKAPNNVEGYSAYCAANKACKLYIYKDLTVKTYYYEVYDGANVWSRGYTDQVITTRAYLDIRYL